MYIRETYHEIDPSTFPPVEYYSGRPLNPPDDWEDEDERSPELTDGHKLVYVNEIFEDSEKRRFRVIDVLGYGTFSFVFKCQMLDPPHDFVALKIVKNLPQYHSTGVSESLIHNRLARKDDPRKEYVSKPISTFEVDKHVCMCFPLYGRSLFEGIPQGLSPFDLLDTVRRIAKQLLEALAFVHKCGVIHCDVKPDNIVYVNEFDDKICLIDFGSASTNGGGHGQYIQSRFYRSFEVMMGLPYDSLIDIWSAGCVIAELFLDFVLFACSTESEAIASMVGILGPVPDRIISSSRNWWKFYDMTPQGFKLKEDPRSVLLTKHLYRSVYEDKGPVPLEQLIIEHREVSGEEKVFVECFAHFVKGLLEYDTDKRWSAEQALQHPFLSDMETFSWTGEWNPPSDGRVRRYGGSAAMTTESSAYRRYPGGDFLSHM